MNETTTTQPAPLPGFAPVEPVARELTARIAEEQFAKGLAEYGTPLMAGNGRDALMDALTELHDGTRYITQAILERDRDKAQIESLRDRVRGAEAASESRRQYIQTVIAQKDTLLRRIDIAEREINGLRAAMTDALVRLGAGEADEACQVLKTALDAHRKDLNNP